MAGRSQRVLWKPGGCTPRLRLPTCQEKEVTVPSRMLLAWLWLLALGLLVGRGEAQLCTKAYGGPNLARGKNTSQAFPSSNSDNGSSGCPVKGNCNGDYDSGSCSETEKVNDPWWSVDLGKNYSVSLVVVKNRHDCCGDRIQGATVYVGNYMGDFGSSSITCGTITNLDEGSLTTIHCNGAVGRYVTIAITERPEQLTLCGVEVYGTSPLSRHC